MKQSVAIVFLLVYLFAGSTLQQLMKVPVLLEHYREHKAMDQHISMLGFFTMHYLSGAVKDADYARDMQLPYKSAEQASSPSPSVYIPPMFSELILSPPLLAQKDYPLLEETGTPTPFGCSIWQPPKHC
ncbi:MAG: hypothetical protein LPK03_10280 [Pontibacter sp.]|nr:hypothetical protein [Pontibacter sp.]